MTKIDPTRSAQLNGGTLIALSVLTDQLDQQPHIVSGWARRGVRGHRLPTIVLAGRRYTTVQACQRFAALVNTAAGKENPLSDCLGRLECEELVP